MIIESFCIAYSPETKEYISHKEIWSGVLSHQSDYALHLTSVQVDKV